jgi:alpha-ketoglutarate-dependent taurine dioxygenase
MYAHRRMPLVVEVIKRVHKFAEVLDQTTIARALVEHGAILFRGFNLSDADKFAEFLSVVSRAKEDYMYRSTPRTLVQPGIYTSTEYPANQEIPLHNENAYQRSWPSKVAFCCILPASDGGATPLADMNDVTSRIGVNLIDKFESRGVRYTRHFRPYVDISWQTAFQTSNFDEAKRYCDREGIQCNWVDKDVLRTTQICQGTVRHPETGMRLFFNQAHLFHISSVGPAAMRSLIEVFGADFVPRNSCFGTGEQFGADELEVIRTAFSSEAIEFPWQTGDALLLDNMQAAHGRRPYRGSRRVLASLLDVTTLLPRSS